ncbi:helix-turn-helix domain-containing protein [Chloroflexi bacterium TSY]|nr:helix-turn-helix domain-containing protein [Chloroflexi bacterium TSY]
MALYVRKLGDIEREQLELLMHRDESDLPRSRLKIVELSSDGKRVPEISEEVDLHPINVRKWIHRFNQDGFDGLRSGKSPGRPPLFTESQRRQIARIAMTNPRMLGLNFSKWSLQRLRKYLIEQGIVKCISVETVRQIVQSSSAEPIGRHRWL